MPIFNSGGDIFHTDGSRVVWSTSRRPAILLPNEAVTVPIDIAYPDLAKSNAYAFDIGSVAGGITRTVCMSMISINPQEWDSGLSFVCALPAAANYFEVQVNLSRIVEPSTYVGAAIPKILKESVPQLLDGASALLERIGPIARMMRFEQSAGGVYLRRKQSVENRGSMGIWTPGNAVYYASGGKMEGWTYGGSPNAWPAYVIESRGPTGNINKERGGSNACSLGDPTNYSSLWRGTVIVTPGYIAP